MHLFTYGTLMFPEVWQMVVGLEVGGRGSATLPAALAGYEIYRIRDAVYPGIIAAESALTSNLQPQCASAGSVPGLLYLDVDAGAFERLDRFEGSEYRRQTVLVNCQDGRRLAAEAYVVTPEARHLLTEESWTAAEFQARGHLAVFVAHYVGFGRLD